MMMTQRLFLSLGRVPQQGEKIRKIDSCRKHFLLKRFKLEAIIVRGLVQRGQLFIQKTGF
jgi:hypothetical protein